MGAVGAEQNGWLRKLTGWSLLAVGITGCLLPIIPGIPFVLAGLLLLARDYAWARSALRTTKRWVVRMRRRNRERKARAAAAADSSLSSR